MSLGIEVNILPAAVEHVRARGGLVVAQLNPHMPYTLGDGELDVELIDLAIEAEERCARRSAGPAHEHAEQIAELVAELVPDGPRCSSVSGRSPTRRCARSPRGAGWRSGRR